MNYTVNEQLKKLCLSRFGQVLEQQESLPELYQDMSFTERLSLLLDEELNSREQRKVERLIRQARFRLQAHPEQIDYRAERGLDKVRIRSLLEGHWLRHHQHLIFTGATGSGKTYLGCAIGHYYCQQGLSVRYFRLKGLQEKLLQVHGDGSYNRFLGQLSKCEILMIDDWGMECLTGQQRSDLLDIIDARHDQSSLILMSQLPVAKWHELIGEATYADAILDRVVHRAQRFELKGDSMRKMTTETLTN